MVDMILEEWAIRHGYGHHSNPKSKDRAKIIFDKCYVRPQLNKAWEIIKDTHDNSDLKAREWAKTILDDLNPQTNGQDNCAMLSGRLVQEACDKVLIKNADESKAFEEMLSAYENYDPREWDGGEDKEKWHMLKDTIVATTKNAIMGIQEATAKENKVIGETDIYKPLPNNILPYFTKPDYNRKGELKTKWMRKNSRSKTGFSSASLPKSIGMFEVSHVWQMAGAYALNGNQPPWLLYVNDQDYVIYNQDNCDELKHDNLVDIANQISKYNQITERMLRLAPSTSELFELVYPQWDALCWQEPPSVLKHAKTVFEESYEKAKANV